MSFLDLAAHFTQSIGTDQIFVETDDANYIYSDPQAGGNNTMRNSELTYARWSKGLKLRDLGRHVIRNFCGNSVRLING